MSRPPLHSSLRLRQAALIAWMGFIFWMSADADSGKTSGFFMEGLQWLLPALEASTLDLLHHLLRKAAHMIEYAVLALLWLGVLPPGPRRLAVAFAATVLYACTDELHQAFVPGRGPLVTDVVVDAAGAALALAAYHLRLDIKTKYR